jgi:hypothetical protein
VKGRGGKEERRGEYQKEERGTRWETNVKGEDQRWKNWIEFGQIPSGKYLFPIKEYKRRKFTFIFNL